MKKMLYQSLLVAGVAISTSLLANVEMAEQDIVVIDSMQIMQMTQKGRAMSARIDKYRGEAEKELFEMQQEFIGAQKQFEEKRMAMSEQAIRDEERRLARLERELKNKAQDMQTEFQEKIQMAMAELSQELRTVVAELAVEYGWKRVDDLTSGQVIYIADSEDVTKEVIAGWDKKLKPDISTDKHATLTA